MQGREWPAINQRSFQHARCCVSDVLRRPCERKTSQSINFKAFGTAHWDDGKSQMDMMHIWLEKNRQNFHNGQILHCNSLSAVGGQ